MRVVPTPKATLAAGSGGESMFAGSIDSSKSKLSAVTIAEAPPIENEMPIVGIGDGRAQGTSGAVVRLGHDDTPLGQAAQMEREEKRTRRT